MRWLLSLHSTGSKCAGFSSCSSQALGLIVRVHGLSCFAGCGIFPHQGSNPHPLPWQVNPYPLYHQGSPQIYIFLNISILLYMNRELPDVQASFRKGRGTRDQIVNIRWIMEKAREFQKNIYFCFIDYAKAFDCVDHNKLWKILKEMRIPDHLTCLLRNLYAGQEATVRTGHGTTDWFQIGKGVRLRLYIVTLLI